MSDAESIVDVENNYWIHQRNSFGYKLDTKCSIHKSA